jgi:branched-chain amino acid transport system permease protein
MTRSRQLGLLVLAGLVLALPLVLTPNLVNAAIKMMIAALFALSFSLAMGQAGMLSFGHSAYYGLGAFATLHLMRAVEHSLVTWPTPLMPLAGAAAGFVCGLGFGWLATQRTGVYFAMVFWRWPSCSSRWRRPDRRFGGESAFHDADELVVDRFGRYGCSSDLAWWSA